MTYFVSYQCVGCKSAQCVLPCPTAAFAAGKNCLMINADLCIDCGACVDQCPVGAILSSGEVSHIINSNYEDLTIERKIIKFFYELNQEYGFNWPLIKDPNELPNLGIDCENPLGIRESILEFGNSLEPEEREKYKTKVAKIFGSDF